MNSPVDPTSTPAWAELENLHRSLDVDFRKWFAEEPNRAQQFTLRAGDLTVDLSRNYLNQQVRDTLVSLAAQVERLERYVAAMSGLQKLEDRAVVARPTRFDSVAGMVEDAGTGLAAHADRTFALSVSARCDRERPELCVDQAIVGEVAENLLNNAMRYASSQVDARLDVRDGALVLMVEDDGPGFSNAALERGCAPFFSEVPSAEHFGLGLNIASLMCEKHGGGVTLENREGGGARVVARFSLDFCAE